MRSWDKQYGSLLAFYEDNHGQHLTETHTIGRLGATLMISKQSAGDWSDAPVPDFVLTRLATAPVPLTMDIGGGRIRTKLPLGAFVVIPPDFATTFLIDAPHRVELVGVNYKRLLNVIGASEDVNLPLDGDFGWLHRNGLKDQRTESMMDRVWREARSGNPHGALGADGLILQLLGALLTLRDSGAVPSKRGRLACWQVRRVCAYLDDNIANDVALQDLAALVGLSPSHFCRAFAVSLGMPPHRWFMARRIERARDLLSASPMAITEIALACGFASSQHFASAFRKAIGTTPTAYRHQKLY
jgi:AraC family transcriptional regulator